MNCLNQTGTLDENNKPFVSKTLSRHIDKLISAGLLIQESGQSPQCHPLLTEIATRDAVGAGRFEILALAVEEKLPIRTHWQNGPRIFQNTSQLIREVRIGLYRQNLNYINKQFEDYHKYNSQDKISVENIFEQICNNPFDADWLRTLPQGLYESAISIILLNAALRCSPAEEPFALLEEQCSTPGGHSSDCLQLILTEQLLLRGCIQEAQQSLERLSDEYRDNAAVFGVG